MVTTRSKARMEDGGNDLSKQQQVSKAPKTTQQKSKNANTSRKRKEPASSATPGQAANQGKKRKDSVAEHKQADKPQEENDHAEPQSKKDDEEQAGQKQQQEDCISKATATKLQTLMAAHGAPPLHEAPLDDPTSPTPSTILAHLLAALLSSTRISHDIAARTLGLLLRARYHDLPTLRATTWQQRTELLTEGGYTHYREKTATELGELAALVEEKYGGDASAMLPGKEVGEGEAAREELRGRLKAIKGFGDVGCDIFVAGVQGVWPQVAPFLDRRSRETAGQIELGKNVEALYEAFGRDPAKMAELNTALTKVRLEKRVEEFKG
ncbi:hypothetical protein B0J12DRAFT_400097 [Macrophomina phaseolina]|uniref:HhH-GPD domain-containing protein n=1 Tax=Macrophomina phaseolina TaxID=35725 RepID=A0ABQ8GIE1_9PEZI|nr:hypothetical protein B0J12DRAFT_400097 [Macrophomina phaseolina]